MPRQCEEVALPEQAINRGDERYHRGGRMQDEYPDPIGAWLVHSCSASLPVSDGGDVAQAPHIPFERDVGSVQDLPRGVVAPVRRRARLTTYLSLRVAELLTPH
jgi:hypothetical protein